MREECPRTPPNPPSVEALFDNAAVENRIRHLSALCSVGEHPQRITGALQQVLEQYFCDANNINSPLLRETLVREGLWEPESGDGSRGLYIEPLEFWDPDRMGKRPAILIKENDWDWQRQGIGDQCGEDVQTGSQFFTGLWIGSHTVFCLDARPAATQLLASEVLLSLLWFGAKIANELHLANYVVAKRGALSAVKEAAESYVIPIVILYATSHSWCLTPEAPRLKNVVIRPQAY